MPTQKQRGLRDQVSESISNAILLVREIFATERAAATATDSISKRRETVFFDII
jgi:hypothetical protein